MRRLHVAAVLLLAWPSFGFLDFRQSPAVEGNESFRSGDYEAAMAKYGEALVDEPESARLNFNMGAAHYKLGKYEEAMNSWARVGNEEGQPSREAKVAYNAGNAQFRLAEKIETEDPQKAIEAYGIALAAFRRSIGADASDEDAKFNYELTLKRIQDIKDWLEKQKEEQQQNPENQEQPEPEDQGEEGEQQPQEQEAEQEPQEDPQQQADQEQGEQEPQPADGDQGDPAPGEAEVGEEMTEREAAALIDMAGEEEIRPEDFTKQMRGAVVAEPAQDW